MNQRIQFRAFDAVGVDRANGILNGVIVCTLGEAAGHGYEITTEFLKELVTYGNAHPIKFRVDPPGKDIHGGALSVTGRASNFRVDGECVRADVKLEFLDEEETQKLLERAEKTPDLIGISIDADVRQGKKNKTTGLTPISLIRLSSLDIVDDPAAVPALFSRNSTADNADAADNSKASAPSAKSAVIPSARKVDTRARGVMPKTTSDSKPSEQFLARCAKFGIDPKADDAAEQVQVKLESALMEAEQERDDKEKEVKELQAMSEYGKCSECGAPVGLDGHYKPVKMESGDDEEDEAKDDKKAELRRGSDGVETITLSRKNLEEMVVSAVAKTVHVAGTKFLARTGQTAPVKTGSNVGPEPTEDAEAIKVDGAEIKLNADERALCLHHKVKLEDFARTKLQLSKKSSN